MRFVKENSFFIIFFGALFFIFFYPIIFLGKTFYFGDYRLQHTPWMFTYATALKGGYLPYWTNLMACGFPLVAEGQIGAYYLLHIFLYYPLPFNTAYNMAILIPFLIGGVGFYLYGKKIGLSKEGAALAAVIFSFSSAYAGCFSNTAGLRALTWFPWALILVEKFEEKILSKKILWGLILGIILSQIWTAGSLQLAAYALVFLGLVTCLKKSRWKTLPFLATSFLLSVMLSLPQLAATAELSRLSVRSAQDVAFALWGSVLPPSLISLIYPEWGIFLRLSFYIGIVPLFLAGLCVFSKKSKTERVYLILAIIFGFLALGKYNPLYALCVEKLNLTFLRNPAKFLFFTTVAVGILAGFGYDRLFQLKKNAVEKFIKILVGLAGAVLTLPLVLSIFFRQTENIWRQYGKTYAEKVFSEKADKFKDLPEYYEMINQKISGAGKLFSYDNPWNWVAIGMFAVSVCFVWIAVRGGSKKWAKTGMAALIVLDLSVFGYKFGTGVTNNILPVESTDRRAVYDVVSQSQEQGGLVAESVEGEAAEMLTPNYNMLHRLRHVGGYSPLLIKRYYDLTKDFGFSDASLGRHPFSREIWLKERAILDALGVEIIISDKKPFLPDVETNKIIHTSTVRDKRIASDRCYLYKNKRALPSLYAVYDWKVFSSEKERLDYLKGESFDPIHEVIIEERAPEAFNKAHKKRYTPASEVVSNDESLGGDLDLESDGIVVARLAYYPGWRAVVDGAEKKIIPINHALSGVFVGRGKHRVEFFYDRHRHRIYELAALAGWIFAIVTALYASKRTLYPTLSDRQ